MLSIFNLSGGTAQSGRSHCSIQAEPLLNFAGRADFAERCTHFTNAVVAGGITIGDNVTIGAGAVVMKDVPANSIVMGNPCVIREKQPSGV